MMRTQTMNSQFQQNRLGSTMRTSYHSVHRYIQYTDRREKAIPRTMGTIRDGADSTERTEAEKSRKKRSRLQRWSRTCATILIRRNSTSIIY
eukprot:4201355-Amphidinium_carterae.6